MPRPRSGWIPERPLSPRALGPLALAGFLLAALALPRPAIVAAQEQPVSLPLGSPGPAVTLSDLDEDPVELLDYRGTEATLIEFWASWCQHCRALEPQLREIGRRYGDRVGIVAIAVAVSQSLDTVRGHVEDHAPGHPYLWDGEGAAVRAYQVPTTGVVVILDGDGKVAYADVGSQQDLVGAVEAVLGGR